MSNWIDINDPEDISLSRDGEEVHFLYDSDNFGNNYISVNKDMLLNRLKELGCDAKA